MSFENFTDSADHGFEPYETATASAIRSAGGKLKQARKDLKSAYGRSVGRAANVLAIAGKQTGKAYGGTEDFLRARPLAAIAISVSLAVGLAALLDLLRERD